MTAESLASEIVEKWDELSRDCKLNRQNTIANLIRPHLANQPLAKIEPGAILEWRNTDRFLANTVCTHCNP